MPSVARSLLLATLGLSSQGALGGDASWTKTLLQFDADKDGQIAPKEIVAGVIKEAGIADETWKHLNNIEDLLHAHFDVVDGDKDGKLSLKEFVHLEELGEAGSGHKSEHIGDDFLAFDQNNDKLLTKREVMHGVMKEMSVAVELRDRLRKVERVLQQHLPTVDKDGDGLLNAEEFAHLDKLAEADNSGEKDHSGTIGDFDINKDGFLSKTELLYGTMRQADISKEQWDHLNQMEHFLDTHFFTVDVNGDGKLNHNEFMNLHEVHEGSAGDAAELEDDFIKFDANKDGLLTKNEVIHGIMKQSAVTMEMREHLIKVENLLEKHFDYVDTDGNGKLSAEEFSHLDEIAEKAESAEHTHKHTFLKYDVDRDEKLTKNEVLYGIMEGEQITAHTWEHLNKMELMLDTHFFSHDKDRNGQLSADEFFRLSEAIAGEPGGKDEHAEHEEDFTRFDLDKDGQLTKREVLNSIMQDLEVAEETRNHVKHVEVILEKNFNIVDEDGDGKLTYEEFSRLDEIAEKAAKGKDKRDETIAKFDLDRDGRVSKNEVLYGTMKEADVAQETLEHLKMVEDLMQAHFPTVDRNGDGKLSVEEFAHLDELADGSKTTSEESAKNFAHFDSNKDGVLTKMEVLQGVLGEFNVAHEVYQHLLKTEVFLEERFSTVDADGDGKLTADELAHLDELASKYFDKDNEEEL